MLGENKENIRFALNEERVVELEWGKLKKYVIGLQQRKTQKMWLGCNREKSKNMWWSYNIVNPKSMWQSSVKVSRNGKCSKLQEFNWVY